MDVVLSKYFGDEVIAAGLGSVRFTWRQNGQIVFAAGTSEEDKAMVLAIARSHRPDQVPSRPVPEPVPEPADIGEMIDAARTIDDLKAVLRRLVAGGEK